MHSDGYDVHISFKCVRYSEGERHLSSTANQALTPQPCDHLVSEPEAVA
jgi:hypothetical protein